MRGARVKPKVGFRFNVQKQPESESGCTFLVKKPYFETRTENHQGGRESAEGASTISLTHGRREVIRDSIHDVL